MLNIRKLIKSFRYAFSGLAFSINENQNIKIHLIVGIIVLIFALILDLSRYEVFSIVLLIVLVISAEMINTAIEEVVNLLANVHSQEAKTAKDVSAGMVLLISIFAFVVGLFIFIPHVLSFIK